MSTAPRDTSPLRLLVLALPRDAEDRLQAWIQNGDPGFLALIHPADVEVVSSSPLPVRARTVNRDPTATSGVPK